MPVHSGMAGGGAAGRGHRAERDPRPAVLGQRPAADPGLLRPGPAADGQGAGRVHASCRATTTKFRKDLGVRAGVPGSRWRTGCSVYEQTWRRPAVTVIAQEASSIKGASNQVLPKASAIVSCRIVPDQEPGEGARADCRRS